MGSSSSKPEKNGALHLCRERMRFIRQATDSRYALSAAHLAYIQSLRNVGGALRRFAEAEGLTESSLSTSEPDKSPSHSSYASPSPTRIPENASSPSRNSDHISPRLSNISYMRVNRSTTVTVKMESSSNHFVDDESLGVPFPPPPPPPEWDFFKPADSDKNCKAQCGNGPDLCNSAATAKFKKDVVPSGEVDENNHLAGTKESSDNPQTTIEIVSRPLASNPSAPNNMAMEKPANTQSLQNIRTMPVSKQNGTNELETLAEKAKSQQCSSRLDRSAEPDKELCAEREDPSEFITHRAKDFLSSIKDIEHRFVKAAESGNDVSRMLEANKIRLGNYLDKIGRSPPVFLSSVHLPCCNKGVVLDHELTLHVNKVITWNRSTSSISSSSKNPVVASAVKDDCDSSSDFVEEFSMIAGSHSSTLDRLYAWERKLYDEVKASESIRKVYDRKCCQLRYQFAKDQNNKMIDKTRAVIKDLHSQVRVGIQAVDSISKRIEKLRDEELLPQLVELMQGFIKMWKAMLASHHTQYITISLAYHMKNSGAVSRGDTHKQVLVHLQNEMECFASSFTMWVDALELYVESLNSWLQNCILLPQERPRRKAAFSPRRALAPPIFVLFRDWSAGIKSLPSENLSNAIKALISELHASFPQQAEKQLVKGNEEAVTGQKQENGRCEEGPNMGSLQASLTKTFDCMTKFAEASLKMYEDTKKSSETARDAYANGRMRFLL